MVISKAANFWSVLSAAPSGLREALDQATCSRVPRHVSRGNGIGRFKALATIVSTGSLDWFSPVHFFASHRVFSRSATVKELNEMVDSTFVEHHTPPPPRRLRLGFPLANPRFLIRFDMPTLAPEASDVELRPSTGPK